MKTPIFYFILLINSLNCFINHAQANTDKISQNQEIIKFLDDYLQHFNDYLKDRKNTDIVNKMVNTYHKSAFQVIPGVAIVPLDNPEKLAKDLQSFSDYLVAQEVTNIQWKKVNIELLTDTTAYVSNVDVWYKKDHQVYKDFGVDFLLLKAEEGWKIAVYIARSAQESSDSKQIPDVRKLLTKYLKNHNDILEDEGDNSKLTMSALRAVSDDFNIPAISVSQQGAFVLFTAKKQIVDNTKSFIFDLKQQGVTHINYDNIQIKMLTDETALASNIASTNKADNSVIYKFGMTYLIHKGDKGWKILTRTMHSKDNILRIN